MSAHHLDLGALTDLASDVLRFGIGDPILLADLILGRMPEEIQTDHQSRSRLVQEVDLRRAQAFGLQRCIRLIGGQDPALGFEQGRRAKSLAIEQLRGPVRQRGPDQHRPWAELGSHIRIIIQAYPPGQ